MFQRLLNSLENALGQPQDLEVRSRASQVSSGAGRAINFVVGTCREPSSEMRASMGAQERYVGIGINHYEEIVARMEVSRRRTGRAVVRVAPASAQWPIHVQGEDARLPESGSEIRVTDVLHINGVDVRVRDLLNSRAGSGVNGEAVNADADADSSRPSGQSRPSAGPAEKANGVALPSEAKTDANDLSVDDPFKQTVVPREGERAEMTSLASLAQATGSQSIIKEFGQVRSEYKWVTPREINLSVREHEHDKFVLGRLHGAGDRVLTLFTDQRGAPYVARIQSRLQEMEFQFHKRVCTPDVLSQIREEVERKESEVKTSSEEFELYQAFEAIVSEAIQQDASDIHFEIRESVGKIRFRVHGELVTVRDIAETYGRKLVRAVYNIGCRGGSALFNEGEIQQGRIEDEFNGVRAGLRLQNDPCFLEGTFDFVMRVMRYDTSNKVLSPEQMGFHESQAELIRRQAAKPVGSVVIAGTTGSGKSTTLYHITRWRAEFYGGTRKILTVEDPVERLIPEATQMEVSRAKSDGGDEEKSGWTAALEAALRSDPDIMLIGEVRDGDSARLFARATETGHQTLTTVHTGDPFGVVTRFVDLGVDENVACGHNFFNCLIHQRLVQHYCHACARTYEQYCADFTGDVHKNFQRRLETFFGDLTTCMKFRGPRNSGCRECGGMTIVGRSVCAEVVATHDEDQLELLRPGSLVRARRYWEEQGNLTAFGHGVVKVLEGKLAPEDLEGSVDPIPQVPLPDFFGEGHIVTKLYNKVLAKYERA